MIKKFSIALIFTLIILSCSNRDNEHDEKIQGDWKSENGRALSFNDTLYEIGWAFNPYHKFEIIEDTILLHRTYSKTYETLLIKRLSENILWLKNLAKGEKSFSGLYHKIKTYSNNIDFEKIEINLVSGGCFNYGYRILCIEDQHAYLQVRGGGKNKPNQLPVETGYYKALIPDNIYQTLLAKLQNIRFDEIKLTYPWNYEKQYIILKIRRLDNNKITQLNISGGKLPIELSMLTSYAVKQSANLSFQKMNTAHAFELRPQWH